MTAAVADRVDRGLAWLAEYGAVDRIDPDKLDVAHPYDCPLAQASGTSFASACARFGLSSAFTLSHGFEGDGETAHGFWDDVIALNDAWAAAIRLARREMSSARLSLGEAGERADANLVGAAS